VEMGAALVLSFFDEDFLLLPDNMLLLSIFCFFKEFNSNFIFVIIFLTLITSYISKKILQNLEKKFTKNAYLSLILLNNLA
jgi:hypothetical protein